MLSLHIECHLLGLLGAQWLPKSPLHLIHSQDLAPQTPTHPIGGEFVSELYFIQEPINRMPHSRVANSRWAFGILKTNASEFWSSDVGNKAQPKFVGVPLSPPEK